MNFYFEPVNLLQWNMFDKVKSIGHVEPFLATKAMEIGDYVLLHVGAQCKAYTSGIYAVGTIINGPYILQNSPGDYCNGKSTVDVRIDKINYTCPFITHEDCKQFITQYRTVHHIKESTYKKLSSLLYLSTLNTD